MTIFQSIEQSIVRIEEHIGHIVALREQYVKDEGGQGLAEVNNKISGLKAWLQDIREAIFSDKEKISHAAEDLKKDL
ncbi:MAG: hypothetical protein KGJ06_04240 [Pseudomonadota bacterium]|nr:hypothetical protein [Pseudomonadota bacterium]